jgi:hypothetical protein
MRKQNQSSKGYKSNLPEEICKNWEVVDDALNMNLLKCDDHSGDEQRSQKYKTWWKGGGRHGERKWEGV